MPFSAVISALQKGHFSLLSIWVWMHFLQVRCWQGTYSVSCC